jgi:hypothetical protein
MLMAGPLILSLCDHTGNWSRPYEEAGYQVIRVDLADGRDVRLLEPPDEPVRGILAAPPCDHFALSGARWWAGKGQTAVIEGLALVDACLRLVAVCRPEWWALENPVGRLRRFLGPPAWSFQPCQFGDPWTKKTCLWGHFTPPTPLLSAQARKAVVPTMGSRMHRMGSQQKAERSETPMGFARAFFEANP